VAIAYGEGVKLILVKLLAISTKELLIAGERVVVLFLTGMNK
jgi:hypothetical protein